MTVFKTLNRKDYTAGGGTTFAFDFKIYDETDLLIFLDGILQTTGYTISGGPIWTESGANVIFGTAPAVGSAIAIIRLLPLTQGTAWPEGGPFPSASHEAAADRLVMIAQQFDEAVQNRIVKLPITSTITNLELPEGQSAVIGWNAAGDALQLYAGLPEGAVIDEEDELVIGNAAGQPVGIKPSDLQLKMKLDDFASPDDNTDLNASITKHGLCPKLGSPGSPAPKGYFSNLLIKPATEGGAGSRSMVITADSVVMEEPTNGTYYEAKTVNVTLDISTSGVNGLDTGNITVATWYFIWLIFNGTTVASLISLSATAPTMPTGYTYKKLLGAIRNIGFVSQLHMDGADSGTTFTDQSGKIWTANGDAKTKTDEKKFGTASAYFDGVGDWIDTPDHADFTLGKSDFTIEFRVKRGLAATAEDIMGQSDNVPTPATVSFRIMTDVANNLIGSVLVDTYEYQAIYAGFADMASWHHVAFVRKGGLIKIFLDGVGGATLGVLGGNSINNSAFKFAIGRHGEWATYFKGNIDEFSMVVGLAKYWENFTPPTAALGDLCQILPLTQIDREVQLGYPMKVGDDVGGVNTASLSLATVVPATITKGVYGKVLRNTGAGWWFAHPTTFPNSIGTDNNFTLISTTLAVGYLAQWNISILMENQVIYHQVDANTVDIWVGGYDLKGI